MVRRKGGRHGESRHYIEWYVLNHQLREKAWTADSSPQHHTVYFSGFCAYSATDGGIECLFS